MDSRFEGSAIEFLGYIIFIGVFTILSLGLAYPWLICAYYKWEAKNTVISGKRLKFIGTGGSLFLNNLKWMILVIITFGIYSFWLQVKLLNWKISNTVFDE